MRKKAILISEGEKKKFYYETVADQVVLYARAD